MQTFNIVPVDTSLRDAIQHKLDNLTKTKDSLGVLEEIALQISMIQGTLSPELKHPHHILFAADHGIVEEGVSPCDPKTTYQMLINFTKGGATINFLARQHNIALKVVDSGVNYDFSGLPKIIDRKIRNGTRNFLHEAAMTEDEMNQAIQYGADLTYECFLEGCNIISFGEMGIGNTSPTSIWVTTLTDIPLKDAVNPGAGLDEEGVSHKFKVLQQALENYTGPRDPIHIMQHFGGYELVMTVGAMLKAAELKMIIVIDGIIMHAALLMACRLYPHVRDYAIFGHCGPEPEHRELLRLMNGKPLLDLNLHLGEGSGALLAYPLIDSSVRMINEMATYEAANVLKLDPK